MLRGMGIPDFDFQMPWRKKPIESHVNPMPIENNIPARKLPDNTTFKLPGLSPPTNTQPSRFSRVMQSPITRGIINGISRPPQTNSYTGNIRSRLRGLGRVKSSY